MKHTQGPWKVTNESYGNKNQYPELNIRTEQNSFVCTIPEQNEANAHLIAAAPEMLEALEHVLNTWAAPEIETGIGMFPDTEEYTKISNLIKKAKGEL